MKSTNIIYWLLTGLFGMFMLSSGIQELMHTQSGIEFILKLGYPAYMISFLGTAKILGAIAILVPGFPRLKEWAYAGFFFAMTGALASHLACADYSVKGLMGPFFQIVFILLSWYYRPADRKIVAATDNYL